jgi:16S rRNA (guanine(966)-N(2))-methyltransferase RsmD
MLRVISGTAKGIRLKKVENAFTRPIQDRVKESLFNIIKEDLKDKIFLDLYAGTGSVGIEALSQGCAKATFVEKNIKAVEVIRYNLEKTKLIKKAEIIKEDVLKSLKNLYSEERRYDFIFIAPPQFKELLNKTLYLLERYPIYDKESIIIGQAHPKEIIKSFPTLSLKDKRRYGDTLLLFYQKQST